MPDDNGWNMLPLKAPYNLVSRGLSYQIVAPGESPLPCVQTVSWVRFAAAAAHNPKAEHGVLTFWFRLSAVLTYFKTDNKWLMKDMCELDGSFRDKLEAERRKAAARPLVPFRPNLPFRPCTAPPAVAPVPTPLADARPRRAAAKLPPPARPPLLPEPPATSLPPLAAASQPKPVAATGLEPAPASRLAGVMAPVRGYIPRRPRTSRPPSLHLPTPTPADAASPPAHGAVLLPKQAEVPPSLVPPIPPLTRKQKTRLSEFQDSLTRAGKKARRALKKTLPPAVHALVEAEILVMEGIIRRVSGALQ